MRLLILSSIVLVLAGGVWLAGRPVRPAPGVLAPEAPRQEPVAGHRPFRQRGHDLTPVATFEVRARVLGKKRYRSGPAAHLAPYDLALGWGPMSDTAVLDGFTIRQEQRAYAWKADPYPIPYRDVVLNSTNLHVIPATAAVEATLSRIREGQVVRLKGRLVDVRSADGAYWRTSRTRSDAGVGACEIVWVEGLEIET